MHSARTKSLCGGGVQTKFSVLLWSNRGRVGPIYRLADIFDRYRYRYIGIGKLDIGIGHIGIGIGISYSGYRLYWYRLNIG
jgi:hypothetical protein